MKKYLAKRYKRVKHKLEKRIGVFISKLYWTYGRKHDGHSFWTRIMVYHVPNGIDGKFLVAQLNEMTNKIEHRAEADADWLRDVQIGFEGRGAFKKGALRFNDTEESEE